MKLSNNQLKYLKSLHLRKFRQKYHNFIVEGTKIAEEVLTNRSLETVGIYALPEWIKENASRLGGLEDQVVAVSADDLHKISLLSTPNQVLLVVKRPDWTFDPDLVATDLCLYLEDIRDPGNLGTILRVADWFGIPWVFCSPNSVEVFNPKVIQASMGAFLRVKCMEMPFDELVHHLSGLPVYGTVLDGTPVCSTPLSNRGIIVIGNESQGISPDIQQSLTHRISIPQGRGGGAESLNAAVATGIICAFFKKGV
jgi:TrmH family RNA methyltransferase